MRNLVIVVLTVAVGLTAQAFGRENHVAAAAGNYEAAAKDLGLTVEQTIKLRRIDENARKVLIPLHKRLAGQVGDLKKLVNERAEDEKLDVQLTIIRSTENVIEAKNREVQKQKEAVLTVSQRVQLALWKGELMKDWFGVYSGGDGDKRGTGKKEEAGEDEGNKE